MTLSSTNTKPAKGLRLTQSDREKVRKAFTTPLHEANENVFREAKQAWAKKLPDLLFSPEVQRALKVIDKAGFGQRLTSDTFNSVEKRDGSDDSIRRNERCEFGGYAMLVPNSSYYYELPIAVLDEHRSITAKFEARKKVIDDDLVRELNSVLLVAKTRVELATLWPPVEALMGTAWVWAQAEPNTLPTVTTDNITAALEQLQAA